MNKQVFHIMEGAEVLINAPQYSNAIVTYTNCSATINPYLNMVEITPRSHQPAVRNHKVYEHGPIKVMTRKDESYMLTFNIVPDRDGDQELFMQRMSELWMAFTTTLTYDDQRREGLV